jgi:Na+/H+-translocating membrane pyrophosphatase
MDQLNIVLVVSFAVSILAFIVAWLLYRWLTGIKVENKRALELSELIRDGSNTFLKREYRYLAYFCFVVACLIFAFPA